MKKNNKILIAGGTGFIGYHLCKYFIRNKWNVSSVSKFSPKKMRRVNKVKYLYFDLSKKSNLLKLKKNYDYVVNLSGYVDHSGKKSILKTHFNSCKNLALHFKDTKLKKFIQIGTSIENGKAKSPQIETNILSYQNTNSVYGNAKLKSTLFLLNLYRKFNFPVSILRLYLVYGPGQENNRVLPFVINSCLKAKNFSCSPGTQYRDFLYISDLIILIRKVLLSDKSIGQVFNVGFGKPTQIIKIIKKIKIIIGKGVPIFSSIKYRPDEPLKLYPNITKLKKLLKWQPKIKIDLGIMKTIKYYKLLDVKKKN